MNAQTDLLKPKRIEALTRVFYDELPVYDTAQAASCFPLLHACTNNGQCCSGHCGLSGVSLVCLP
jgi:hypothetical protein